MPPRHRARSTCHGHAFGPRGCCRREHGGSCDRPRARRSVRARHDHRARRTPRERGGAQRCAAGSPCARAAGGGRTGAGRPVPGDRQGAGRWRRGAARLRTRRALVPSRRVPHDADQPGTVRDVLLASVPRSRGTPARARAPERHAALGRGVVARRRPRSRCGRDARQRHRDHVRARRRHQRPGLASDSLDGDLGLRRAAGCSREDRHGVRDAVAAPHARSSAADRDGHHLLAARRQTHGRHVPDRR